ncbi:hypothetical protein BHE74_00038779 [Ensete ventricosum]|uniref:Uncharacterized protein n=1 Tax=Ensete ventricosum TaxID=4639 RepID=A0A444CV06_ENSVE|nr:hypothetical protein B296_00017704 [Ensete ventricosum]RWV89629.1 hypothetical protein GW17_00048215 [Ensete ventricosum]RWW54632.1 hypothetical protein BHE74_00038779 [Ensete ventricosum]RZS00931.1 hypothetical protein BHM03_00030718 [Ensete ventricosum]
MLSRNLYSSIFFFYYRILLARLEYLRETFQIKEGDFLTFDALFLRRMAQPYDKAGSGGKKTLLTQEDIERMSGDAMEMF